MRTYSVTNRLSLVSHVEKLEQMPGHQAVTVDGTVYVTCSCGDMRNVYARLTQRGRLSKWVTKAWEEHLVPYKEEVRDPKEVGTPTLVGYLYKPRVTHEYWIFHYMHHDLPIERPKIVQWWSPEQNHDWFRRSPWMVFVKHSRGWRVDGGHRSKQKAIQRIVYKLDSATEHTEIVTGQSLFSAGVSAPIPSFELATKELIKDSQRLRKNVSIHEIQELIERVDAGIAQIDLLRELREELVLSVQKVWNLE